MSAGMLPHGMTASCHQTFCGVACDWPVSWTTGIPRRLKPLTLGCRLPSLPPTAMQALSGLIKLQDLRLADNALTPERALTLAPALAGLRSLRRLYLRFNPLGPEGVVSLLQAVQSLPDLADLYLCGCELSPQGAAPVLPLLQRFSALHKLTLSRNGFDAESDRQVVRDALPGLSALLF